MNDPIAQMPSVLGRCELERCLGAGGMGAVYLGRHTALDIPVAVKVLLPELVQREASIAQRFLREARTAAKIDHPNVVRVLDCGHDQGRYYLIMEYIAGHGLDKEIANGPLPLQRALEVTVAIARGLEAAWKKDIVHRDVKPSNVLVGDDGAIKLVDMGLAKMLDDDLSRDLTATGQVLGTLPYMSPEQVQAPASVNIRSDIYSLGITLFELIEGRRPFEGPPLALPQKHCTAPRPKLTLATRLPDVQGLVESMMAISLEARPQDPSVLIDRLQALLAEAPDDREQTRPAPTARELADTAITAQELADTAIAGPDTPFDVTPKPPRSRLGLGLAALGLVAVVAVAGVWIAKGRDADDATTGAAAVPDAAVAQPEQKLGLNGSAELLDNGRVRIRYDFSDPKQLDDWQAPYPDGTVAVVRDGRLHVSWNTEVEAENPLALLLYRRTLRVNHLSFSARVVSGDHVNWYVQTEWMDDWCPNRAYGGVHRGGERVFCHDGEKVAPTGAPEVMPPQRFEVVVDVAADGVVWSINGESKRLDATVYRGTDRQLAIGSWNSHIAFEEVVIEGELAPPPALLWLLRPPAPG